MSIGSQVYDLLVAEKAEDGSNLSMLVTGSIESRALIRPPAPGKTPDAFDANGRVLPSIVVRARDEGVNLAGPADHNGQFTAIDAFPQLYIYGTTTAAGKTAVESIYVELQRLLLFAELPGEGGSGAGIRIIGASDTEDDPELSAAVVKIVRLQGDGLWSVEPLVG